MSSCKIMNRYYKERIKKISEENRRKFYREENVNAEIIKKKIDYMRQQIRK